MSAVEARSALAAGLGSTDNVSTSQINAQGCTRRPNSRWTACRCESCQVRHWRTRKLAAAGLLPDGREAAEARVAGWIRGDWQPAAVASATGLPLKTCQDLMRSRRAGSPRAMLHRTAAAILTAGRPTAGHISQVGARRQLQALTWMGWTLAALHAETGLPITTLSDIRADNGRAVTHAAIADAIGAAFDRLQHVWGGSTWAREAVATRRGWAPPAAWDEETIDDPAAEPQGVDRSPGTARLANDPALVDEVRVLVAGGLTDRQIGYRVGLGESGVQKLRARNGIRRAA